MPTISSFYGIVIRMYFADHSPPHFHAMYAEFEGVIAIETLTLFRGELPRRALALVLGAQNHREELLEDWELCSENQPPSKIAPLP